MRSKRVRLSIGLPILLHIAALALLPRVRADETAFRPIRVILIRHAEKASDPKEDPPLSESGHRRAQALAGLLGQSGVTALYSSDRLRARQTLQPISERLELAVHAIDAKDTAATARAVLKHPGGVVVVAAHSNTLGPIIEALGGEKIPEIDEGDFDNLFVVTVHAPGKATVTRLRWGP